jgi:hypothetical protein
MICNFDQILCILWLFNGEALPFPEEIDDGCIPIFGSNVERGVSIKILWVHYFLNRRINFPLYFPINLVQLGWRYSFSDEVKCILIQSRIHTLIIVETIAHLSVKLDCFIIDRDIEVAELFEHVLENV